jgi:hypothetical protein
MRKIPYVCITVINDSPLKNTLDEFLKRVCEIAEGDTDKSINVYKIWDDNFPMRSLSRDATLPIVLRSLKAGNLISDGKNKDEIKVTFDGIYYVIDNLNVTPENIGALPRTDVKRFGNLFLQSVYELTKADPTRTVGIGDVQKRIKGISGTTSFIQIAEYLSSKGLIEIVKGNGMIRFRVPSQEIKKYYPPPSPPSPQPGSYTYTSFSSDSFST